jgi:hypothetical protein
LREKIMANFHAYSFFVFGQDSQDTIELFFLPSLMEGRKFNPAYKGGKRRLNLLLLNSITLGNLQLISSLEQG